MEPGWLVVAGVAVMMWLLMRSKRNRREPGTFVWVPGPIRRTNPLKTLIVLAILFGLGWFFWYVMMTRCHGAC
jgi:hypothetical protein